MTDQPTPVAWLRGDPWPTDLFPTRRPLVFVVSGPSGAGKDTVINGLRDRGVEFHYVVTWTTRAPRDGEIDGVHYHFVTPERFTSVRDAGGFVESAVVHGRMYGSPKEAVVDALSHGTDVILKVDVQGALRVRQLIPESVLVFIGPSSFAELAGRLAGRDGANSADYQTRLTNARGELAVADQYDYVVINRNGRADEAVTDLMSIVRSERLRTLVRRCELG